MKLAFALAPDDAARLPRFKPLARLKARRRSRAVSIIWHDTAERTLANSGQALAEQGRSWRVERLAPEGHTWPPGLPDSPVAQAGNLARLGWDPPTGTRPGARFDGRLATLTPAPDGANLTVTVLDGTIGWGRRRRPVCRLTLDGATAPVLELALALAAELDLTLPTAALAAEALGVATATPIVAPALPELRATLSVSDAFTLTLGRHAAAIQREAAAILGNADGPEPVHQMRVAVRRLRSAIAVFRPAVFCPLLDNADQSLKALADRLAPARDLDVFVAETAATVGAALPDDTTLRRLRTSADRHRRAAYTALRTWLRRPDHRRLMILLAALADGTAWLPATEPDQPDALAMPLDRFAAQALKRRLRRLTDAGATIDHLDPDALHAIRLRAKRLRYAAEIFDPLFARKPTARFLRRLASLQNRLGILNDGAVANTLLASLGTSSGGRAHAAGLVRGFLAARSGNARSHIARAWHRFTRADPFWT